MIEINIKQTWDEMLTRLAVAFPQWVIRRMTERSEGKGFVSPAKTVSTFDDRKIAVVNLKLDTPKPDGKGEKK